MTTRPITRRALLAGGATTGGAALTLALSACTTGSSTPDDTAAVDADAGGGTGQYGSLLNRAEFVAAPQLLPPTAVAAAFGQPDPGPLPSSYQPDKLPMITQQGTAKVPGYPGTSEAQSFGSGLCSYTSAQYPDGTFMRDPSQPPFAASAAWLYVNERNAANGHKPFSGRCTGTLAVPYLGQMVLHGAPSVADVPYPVAPTPAPQPSPPQGTLCAELEAIDPTSVPPAQFGFQIGSFACGQVDAGDATPSITLIHELLVSGRIVALSGPVVDAATYGTNPTLTNGVFGTTRPLTGGHGQLVVGYDENVDGTGTPALLVQNSFGASWMSTSENPAGGGRLYWSYGTFATQQLFATAYPRIPDRPDGTLLTATTTGAPAAVISAAGQWADPSSPRVVLAFEVWFADPITLDTYTVTEPTASPGTGAGVRAGYGAPTANGYVYLSRTDGKSFAPGAYRVSFSGATAAGRAVAWSGKIVVAAPDGAPAAATMKGATITSSTGTTAPPLPT